MRVYRRGDAAAGPILGRLCTVAWSYEAGRIAKEIKCKCFIKGTAIGRAWKLINWNRKNLLLNSTLTEPWPIVENFISFAHCWKTSKDLYIFDTYPKFTSSFHLLAHLWLTEIDLHSIPDENYNCKPWKGKFKFNFLELIRLPSINYRTPVFRRSKLCSVVLAIVPVIDLMFLHPALGMHESTGYHIIYRRVYRPPGLC